LPSYHSLLSFPIHHLFFPIHHYYPSQFIIPYYSTQFIIHIILPNSSPIILAYSSFPVNRYYPSQFLIPYYSS
jgi:hypothetical protein